MSIKPKLIFSALAFFCTAASAQAPLQQRVHFFTFENDMRFDTDRYYTNGIQFSLKRSNDNRGNFARKLTSTLCRAMDCDDTRLLTSQSHLGQLMYTPGDITVAEPQTIDRHWGGLLYYEQSYAFVSSDQRTLTTLTGHVGVTGKLSLAEPSQKLFHRIFDRPPPAGWDNQVGGTLGLMATAERRTAVEPLSFNIGRDVRFNTASYWRLAAGNIQTYAAAGVAVVIGKDLPVVSPPPPGIGNKMTDGAGRNTGIATACMVPWLQCTSFGAFEARAVGYNVFLDGRMFTNDRKVRKRNFVHDLMVGTRFDFPRTRTAAHGPWFVQIKITRRSPEFKSSIPIPKHRVAAVTIGTEF